MQQAAVAMATQELEGGQEAAASADESGTSLKLQYQNGRCRDPSPNGHHRKRSRSAVEKQRHDVMAAEGWLRKPKKVERLKLARLLVDKAIKKKKIFSIYGPYPVIRSCLRNRGWVEKKLPVFPKAEPKKQRSADGEMEEDDGDGSGHDDEDDNVDEVDEKDDDPDGIYGIMSRLVRNEIPYFIWTTRRDAVDCRFLKKDQMINHYAKAGFTTKVGLCVNLRNLRWFDDADPDSFFPRCYRLGAEDEKRSFIEDFWLTAARGILKRVSGRGNTSTEDQDITSPVLKNASNPTNEQDAKRTPRHGGRVSAQVITTAIKACETYLNSLEHHDIDMETCPSCVITDASWEAFLNHYYHVIHYGAVIDQSPYYADQCDQILRRLAEVNPQLEIEGDRNIWIVKPGAKSRGRGIICLDRLEEILKLVAYDPMIGKDGKFVVQKYIERPLLIFGTKFDVRQWFLVTDWNPLTVWFYREFYLRFSTQPFSLENLDSSIHLCNNSIQKNFENARHRHPQVPADNMWSSDQFQAYIEGLGGKNAFSDIIIPGMKAAIIHAIQSTQDIVDSRKSSFELYGADFMFGENFQPWLIEINASPTMAPSTPVTTRLCCNVQEDTLRVVIDRKYDRNCDVGGFELIYKQVAVDIPQYIGVNLMVEGATVKKPCVSPEKQTNNLNNPGFTFLANQQRYLSMMQAKASTAGTHETTKQPLSIPYAPFKTKHCATTPHTLNRAKMMAHNKENRVTTASHFGTESVELVSLSERLGVDRKDPKLLAHGVSTAKVIQFPQRLLGDPLHGALSETPSISKRRAEQRDMPRLDRKFTSLDSGEMQLLKKVSRAGHDQHRMPCLFCKGVSAVSATCNCYRSNKHHTNPIHFQLSKRANNSKGQREAEQIVARGTSITSRML